MYPSSGWQQKSCQLRLPRQLLSGCLFSPQRSRLTGTATCRSCLMCAACTGRSRGRRPPQCGPRAGTTAQSSGTAVPHGRPRPVAPAREPLLAQICAPPTPPSASLAAPWPPRWTPGPRPGASRTTLWNLAASGTRPGPETPRPAAVPPEPCRPAARPTSPAPVAPRPELTSSRGPSAHARASGTGSLHRLRQGPRRSRRPLSVSPAPPEPRLGKSPKAPPLGHAPATPRPAPRPSGSDGSTQAQALRPPPPVPGSADERGNRRRLAVSARAHAGLAFLL